MHNSEAEGGMDRHWTLGYLIYMYIYEILCMYVYAYTYVCVCMNTYTFLSAVVSKMACLFIYIHTHTCTPFSRQLETKTTVHQIILQ